MPSRRTRRNRTSGGFLDWLLGKKTTSTNTSSSSNIAKAISTGATAPIINAKPKEEDATVINMNGTASPSVGGRRKSYRKAYRKANRKANRKVTKANRKASRKVTKANSRKNSSH